MNMLVLWIIGPALEEYLGHGRYALLYLVSGLAGRRGRALWSSLRAQLVGASGAIFGIMGAALILEWRRIYVFGGQAMGLVVFNLAIFTFLIPGISIGGHIGGLDRGRPRRRWRSSIYAGCRRSRCWRSSESARSASPSPYRRCRCC